VTGTGYLVMKTIHVLAVVLFLGNIIVGIFWKLHADRSGDPRIIAYTVAGIIRADRWFTMPAAILLVVFGFGAAGIGRVSLASPWIAWSIVLIVISALAFMFKLTPLQRRMLAVARAAADGGELDAATYARLSSSWALWGSVATIAPLIALVLMVFKPA
jgi:Predicted integral membrane protein